MELSLRMKEYRDYYGWTQSDLSEKSGISISTIKKYEAGAVENFTYENLKKISSAFNVSPSEFLDEFLSVNVSVKNENFVPQSVPQSPNLSPNLSVTPAKLKISHKGDTISIPYFEDTYASAGTGVINYDEVPVVVDFSEDFLRTFLRIGESLVNLHIINARGNSMEPTIENGELLFINPTLNEGGVISGCIYVVNFDGDIYVKRVEKDPIYHTLTLFSDNQTYKPIVIDDNRLKECQIIGRVVAHVKRS